MAGAAVDAVAGAIEDGGPAPDAKVLLTVDEHIDGPRERDHVKLESGQVERLLFAGFEMQDVEMEQFETRSVSRGHDGRTASCPDHV
jgi:hypothetical protein